MSTPLAAGLQLNDTLGGAPPAFILGAYARRTTVRRKPTIQAAEDADSGSPRARAMAAFLGRARSGEPADAPPSPKVLREPMSLCPILDISGQEPLQWAQQQTEGHPAPMTVQAA